MKTKLILAILLALLLAGCATQSVNMAIMRPAEVNLYDYNTIAMGDIWGPPISGSAPRTSATPSPPDSWKASISKPYSTASTFRPYFRNTISPGTAL